MGNEGDQHEAVPYCAFKVHGLICLELKKFVDKISQIYPAIESARPRCSSGIQALCSLHLAMDKAKLLLLHCSESSKLYLAITGGRILLRCKSIQSALDSCLSEIQNMVPSLLAAKISGIIEDLRGAKFHLESSEDEAGKVVLALLRQDMSASASINNQEFEAIQLVALRLKIASPLAVLIEKRSVRRLIDKVRDTDLEKKKNLKNLLYLLRKYGELLGQEQTKTNHTQHEEPKYQSNDQSQANDAVKPEPPLEFKCPISMRLMYDPVVIASGKTYERVWIDKWLKEGNVTCPMTHMKLENMYLTPNSSMKSLISKWCSEHGITVSEPQLVHAPVSLEKNFLPSDSIASFGSSMKDLHLQVSNISLQSSDTYCGLDFLDHDNKVGFGIGLPQVDEDSCKCHSATDGSSITLASLLQLALLPWETQRKVVRDVKEHLTQNEEAYDKIFSHTYIKPLIRFLKDAHQLFDLKAQKDSADVLLKILSKRRIEMPYFDGEAIYMLASVLDSAISGKALAIIELLSRQPLYNSEIVASGVLPSILEVLGLQIWEIHELAMKILCNLSCNAATAYHIVYLDCMPKLVPFLGDHRLAGYCLQIINNLCQIEEGRNAVIDTDFCITSIAKLLKTRNEQEQETILEVLLALCYERAESCQLVLEEGIIQFLVGVCADGNAKENAIATELLQVLGHIAEGRGSDCPNSNSGLSMRASSDSGDQPKGKKSSSKVLRYLGRKILRYLGRDL